METVFGPSERPQREQFVLIACLAGYGNEGTSPAESAQKLIDYRSSTYGGIAWSPDGKPGTALPPHQYVIARRVERAKQLLQGGGFSLAEVAAHTRLREPEPVHPALQADCRCHAGAVPGTRKNRLEDRTFLQETGKRPRYYCR
jgi:AraC-like DNA-binding protein